MTTLLGGGNMIEKYSSSNCSVAECLSAIYKDIHFIITDCRVD